MRVALLALLLANLAFFAWSSWLAPKEAALPESPKVEAPQLQLANENAPGSKAGNRCVTVGPFASADFAARARRTLSESGYGSLPREEATTIFEGYWVYLESPPTDAGERRLLARLRKGGIDDATAVGDPGARRISLGVFSDEGRAATQSERVAKLQLLPQIEAREKPGTAIWLDLTLKTDAPSLEGTKFPAGDAELEFKSCPPGTGATQPGGATG